MATSDRRPDELAADGRFLTDLLEIVSAVHIDLPPLSKRREDIPLLAAQCLDDVANETRRSRRRTLSPEAMEALATAKWPGNVRQLRMVVRQVAALGAGAVITPEQVQEALGQATQLPSFDEARDEFTRNYWCSSADHPGQCQPGGPDGEAEPDGLLQAADEARAEAGRVQGVMKI